VAALRASSPRPYLLSPRLRGLEALGAGFDSINLVSDDKFANFPRLNGMLYEFLPPEDQKPTEDRVFTM